jgi:hypothetical protein
MERVVDLSSGAVEIRDGNETKRFSVRAVRQHAGDGGENGALAALAAALSVHDAGMVEPGGDVLMPAAAVRRLAHEAAAERGRTLGPEWDTGFTTMLEYASTRGWMSDDGSIRAQCEWEN